MSQTRSNSIRISVVVPIRNEADSVRLLLDTLLSQTLAPSEIVITDGGSTDGTIEIVETFIKAGAPVKLIREQFALPGRARNIAIKNASEEWLAFIDAGIKPDQNWLAELADKASKNPDVDVVYGTYEPVIDSFFRECAAIAYVPAPGLEDGELVRSRSIASALMRRAVWEKAGGFPEELRSAEDLIFMRRIQELKFKTQRTSRAIVYWTIRPNLAQTFKRFAIYARNNIRAGLFAEWQMRLLVYYTIIAASALTCFALGWWGLIFPPLLWLAFIFWRSFKALHRNRTNYPASIVRNVTRLFVIMPIMTALDAATFAGSLNWLLRDKLGLLKSSLQHEAD
jgi:glycosyltransferase involved in cell wall biosynthesis